MTTPDHTPTFTRIRRTAWQHRREVTTGVALAAAGVGLTTTGPAAYLALGALAALALAVPYTRRWLVGWPRRARTRHQLRAGLKAVGRAVGSLRDADPPRIRRIRSTPVGERVTIRATAGYTAELLENLSPILRPPLRCRVVRVHRDEKDGGKITLDIVRKDPFARGVIIPWADLDEVNLSAWGEVHLGRDEAGDDVRLCLAERGVLLGGIMGSGKSSELQVIVSHFARTPAHLVLIDPNEVQFGPWRDRALFYAGKDPARVLVGLNLVIAEIDRRLGLFRRLPGIVRNLTAAIADEYDLHPILVAIDELANLTSVSGTAAQQRDISTALRDILSRGRAVGAIAAAATQRPTQDVVPRSIADLFAIRIAFKVRNASNSDVILGDGLGKRGYDASEIPLETRGVGLLVAEGTDPIRMQAAWISNDQLADLSVTTIGHKPTPPPGWPVSIGPTIPASAVAA